MSITPLQPTPKLATALGLTNEVYLKREDLHPYHSHKGRSIPNMIDLHVRNGAKDFVVSSSGNAALAALLHIQKLNSTNKANLTLEILLGEKVNGEKLNRLQKSLTDPKRITITKTLNPKQAAFQNEKLGKKLLRQSTDDNALTGYFELAKEIIAEVPNLEAIFIPTSSGTTAEGLHLGFKKFNKKPEIHIVQTEAVHPFVTTTPYNLLTTPSLASAIVDKVGHRKEAITKILKESHGAGYIASNEDIQNALTLAKETLNFEISPNSALALVGLQQAIKSGKVFTGPMVLLITGQ